MAAGTSHSADSQRHTRTHDTYRGGTWRHCHTNISSWFFRNTRQKYPFPKASLLSQRPIFIFVLASEQKATYMYYLFLLCITSWIKYVENVNIFPGDHLHAININKSRLKSAGGWLVSTCLCDTDRETRSRVQHDIELEVCCTRTTKYRQDSPLKPFCYIIVEYIQISI